MIKDTSEQISTYGLLTAERVLERFNLPLGQNKLSDAIHNQDSPYFKWLFIPLKHIFNGLILEQVHDYQVYAQKLFIDYLMSGHADKPKDAPGAEVRKDLEGLRTRLTELNDAFEEQKAKHFKLIANSQADLIQLAQKNTGSESELEAILQQYQPLVEACNSEFRGYRAQFVQLILETKALIHLLPEYHQDEEERSKNLEPLNFDASLGEVE